MKSKRIKEEDIALKPFMREDGELVWSSPYKEFNDVKTFIKVDGDGKAIAEFGPQYYAGVFMKPKKGKFRLGEGWHPVFPGESDAISGAIHKEVKERMNNGVND